MRRDKRWSWKIHKALAEDEEKWSAFHKLNESIYHRTLWVNSMGYHSWWPWYEGVVLGDTNNSIQKRNLAETTKSRTNLRRNGQNGNISFSEIGIFGFVGELEVASSVGMFPGRLVRVPLQEKLTVLVNRWSEISPNQPLELVDHCSLGFSALKWDRRCHRCQFGFMRFNSTWNCANFETIRFVSN